MGAQLELKPIDDLPPFLQLNFQSRYLTRHLFDSTLALVDLIDQILILKF